MKNLKLAFLESHVFIKLLLAALWILCIHMDFLTGGEDMNGVFGTIQLFTFNIVLVSYNVMLLMFTNLKLFKTLPLKSGDITVIAVLNSLISTLLFLAVVSVAFAVSGNGFAIPYYAGALLFSGLFTAATLPLIFWKTKYGTEAMREAEEKPKGHTAKVVTLAIVICVAAAIPGTLLCLRAWRSAGQLMSDIPMLLAVYIGCIGAAAILTLIYRSKIKYYIY